MISAAEFLASERAKKFPDWLKQDPIWAARPTISKVFPDLGLVNCRESYPTEIMDYGEDISKLKKMDIVFSSDGVEGLWDIATMSMRGVLSCKHWDNTHSKTIVSTITSPFTGIIYFTDGTMTEYGLSMNKRALVHYYPPSPGQVANQLVLDSLYAKTTNRDPMKYINKEPDAIRSANIREVFKEFLRSKLNNMGKANTVIR